MTLHPIQRLYILTIVTSTRSWLTKVVARFLDMHVSADFGEIIASDRGGPAAESHHPLERMHQACRTPSA
jgi:hypothetical protein